jgi:hypothetical protein
MVLWSLVANGGLNGVTLVTLVDKIWQLKRREDKIEIHTVNVVV